MRQMGKGLASKGSGQLGVVQAARPAADCRGIGCPIGIFQRGRRLFPRTALQKVPSECLNASQQAVVRVWEGEQGEHGEGLPTLLTKAASNSNPVVMFIVCLLATATVTSDGIAFANWTSPQQDVLAVASPIGFDLVWRGRTCDKKNRAS